MIFAGSPIQSSDICIGMTEICRYDSFQSDTNGHKQTGNLRFRYFKEKNLFFSTSKLISGNSYFQRGQ